MKTLLAFEPDPTVEPGHQMLVIADTLQGRALMELLHEGREIIRRGDQLLIPHDAMVDRNMVDLINLLAHARYSAPEMIQLTMLEAESPS